MRLYTARWVTDQETSRDHEHNGVVESLGSPGDTHHFYVSPMALAERVAAALNVCAKFTTEELKAMAAAISREKPI